MRNYRGFSLTQKKWVYGYLSSSNEITCNGITHEIDPKSIGESIMLKDSNGVTIFTEDFIQYNNNLYIVKYVPEYVRYSAVRPGIVFTSILRTGGNFTVVGNSYVHPQLFSQLKTNNSDKNFRYY